MAYAVKSFKVEGTIENYTVIDGSEKQVSIVVDTKEVAISDMEYELNIFKRYGTEIKMQGDDRAFLIDKSNRVTKMFDVVEL